MAYLLILAVASAIILFSSNFVGEFTLSDDWAYSYAVKDLLERGEVHPEYYGSTALLQVLYGSLFVLAFGFSHTILRMSAMLLTIAATIVVFLFFNRNGFEVKESLLIGLFFLTNLLIFNLSHTFMTDVPFALLFMLSIYFAIEWIKKDDANKLIIAGIIALLSFFVRQFGLVLIASFILFCFIFKRSKKEKLISLLFLVINILAFVWSLPHYPVNQADSWFRFYIDFNSIARIYAIPLYFGLFAFPFFTLLAEKNILKQVLKRRMRLILTASFLIFGFSFGLLFLGKVMPYFSNIIETNGLGPAFLAGGIEVKENLFPDYVWLVLTGLSALTVLLFAQTFNWETLKKEKNRFIAIIIAVYFALLIVYNVFYDRYLIPIIIPVFFLLFQNIKHARYFKPALMLSILILGSFSFVYTSEYIGWQQAAKELTDELLEAGTPVNQINGGHSFCNVYYFRNPTAPDNPCNPTGRPKYAVSFKPLDGWEIVKTKAYYGPFGIRMGEIYLLGKSS